MVRTTFLLFSIWYLILPFSGLTHLYISISGLAIDKAMAPVLMLIWIGMLFAGKVRLDKAKLLLLIHVFVFFLVRNISFVNDASLFIELIWKDAILFGYFALPVLFINNMKRVDIASKLISANAVVACVSAFLVAIGLLVLPYDRFSESRIGFEGIQKSIGVITSYGDVTQLAAFFLLLGIFMPGKLFLSGRRAKKLIKLAVFLIIIMGLIGNQSRSYLLSLIFAYGAALFFSYRGRESTNTSVVDMLLVLAVAFIIPLMAVMLSDIVSALSGMGGKEALGSAGARLGQYEMASTIIRENPLFGVDSEFFAKNPHFAHGVHNMWLGQLTRGGIVSTLILLVLVINIFRRSIRLFKNDNTAGYAKVLIGYLAAVFLSTLFYPADTAIFWSLLGMSVSIIYYLNTNKTELENSSDKGVSHSRYQNKRILHKKASLGSLNKNA